MFEMWMDIQTYMYGHTDRQTPARPVYYKLTHEPSVRQNVKHRLNTVFYAVGIVRTGHKDSFVHSFDTKLSYRTFFVVSFTPENKISNKI